MLFFATVIVFLLFCITRALAWPFCPIYPIGYFRFRLENSGELLGITFRDIPTMGRIYKFGDRAKPNKASKRPLTQASLRCKR